MPELHPAKRNKISNAIKFFIISPNEPVEKVGFLKNAPSPG
jgi:hypothetical protein